MAMRAMKERGPDRRSEAGDRRHMGRRSGVSRRQLENAVWDDVEGRRGASRRIAGRRVRNRRSIADRRSFGVGGS